LPTSPRPQIEFDFSLFFSAQPFASLWRSFFAFAFLFSFLPLQMPPVFLLGVFLQILDGSDSLVEPLRVLVSFSLLSHQRPGRSIFNCLVELNTDPPRNELDSPFLRNLFQSTDGLSPQSFSLSCEPFFLKNPNVMAIPLSFFSTTRVWISEVFASFPQ